MTNSAPIASRQTYITRLSEILRLVRLKGASEDAPLLPIIETEIVAIESGSVNTSDLEQRYEQIVLLWHRNTDTLH